MHGGSMNVEIVDTPDGQYTAHAFLLQCSADLQARCPIINMKCFNGKWGCLYTESDKLRFWPYKSSGSAAFTSLFIDDGKAALQDGNAVGFYLYSKP